MSDQRFLPGKPPRPDWTDGSTIHLDLADPTLRDRFAMAALPALLGPDPAWGDGYGPLQWAMDRSVRAYQIADAMLEARKKTP